MFGNLAQKRALSLILSALRWVLWVAVSVNIFFEIAELYLKINIDDLASSVIFFLLANLQLRVSRSLRKSDEEMSERFFIISMFMICAALIELADLGIDPILAFLANGENRYFYLFMSMTDLLFGVTSALCAGYSMDQFFVLTRRKTRDLLGLRSENYISPLRTSGVAGAQDNKNRG